MPITHETTRFRRTLLGTITLPVLLMALLAGVFLRQTQYLLAANGWIDHTDRVIAQAHYVQTLLVDQETGLRGYLVTGNPEFLEPFTDGERAFPAALSATAQLVAGDPPLRGQVEGIRRDAAGWSAYAHRMIALRSRSGDYQAFRPNREGKRRMDALRAQLRSVLDREEDFRAHQVRAADAATRSVTRTALGGALLLGLAAAAYLRRELLRLNRTFREALAEREASSDRLRRVQQVADVSLAHLRLDELLARLLSRIKDVLGVDTASILLPDEEQRRLILRAACGAEEEARERVAVPVGSGFAGRIAAERKPYVLNHVRPEDVFTPFLREIGVASLMGVPLEAEDRLVGVLHVGSLTPREFTSEELQLLLLAAERCALAIENARLFERIARANEELEERVRARTAALESRNEELQAFSYTVSHDLRAPVRAVQGFTRALAEDYGSRLDGEGCEFLDAIESATQRMDRLIEDLLAYSRLAQAEVTPAPVSLQRVLEDARELLPPRERRAVHVGSPLPLVSGQYTVLLQVVANLLSNALKFVEPGVSPRVQVWAESRADFVRLWVEDNGIGIEPQHHDRIFRVFERLHGIESYPGTGIGLAIVRRAMERLGGRVGLESTPGQGTRFWVELPAAEAGRARPATGDELRAPGADAERKAA